MKYAPAFAGAFSRLQHPPQLLQRPLFYAGYIAAADTRDLGHLPLAVGRAALQAVAQDDHLPLLLGQTTIHRPAEIAHRLPAADPLQQILILTDHVHQRQSCPICAGLYVVGQGNILAGLPLGPKVHQDLVCYPLPNAF